MYETGETLSCEKALMKLMDMDGIPMHCPYHHFIMPAALLTVTAVQEKRDRQELTDWLETAEERAKTVPPGFCGNCGASRRCNRHRYVYQHLYRRKSSFFGKLAVGQ